MPNVPKLQIRIPIAPTPSMLNRVHLITHSIRSLGGIAKDAQIRVSVGADVSPYDLHEAQPWSKRLDIEWSWVDRILLRKWAGRANPNIPTMVYDRFFTPVDATVPDHIIMLDADVIAIRPFEELFDVLTRPVQAVMAHTSPFNDNAHWKEILGPYWDRELHEVSGWKIMEHAESRRLSPPYFNTGVVFLAHTIFRQFPRTLHQSCLEELATHYNSYFIDQIALTNMLVEGAIPYRTLPLRFNFPNQREFDDRHPEELADVRFIHFLRDNVIDRNRDFESLEAMEQLTKRKDLTGSNEIVRARVEELLPLMHVDPRHHILRSDAKA